MKKTIIYALSFVLLFVSVGCVGVPNVGQEGEKCAENGACLEGLICGTDGICRSGGRDGGSGGQDGLGNITFSWSFDGVTDCKVAGVNTMQIVILDAQQQTVFNETRPCTDGETTISDITPGNFTLVLNGLDVSNARLYEASMPLPINIGDNQYGVIDLAASFTSGIVSFTWTFDGGKDCTQAVVITVAITLEAPGGQLIFSDSPACGGGAYSIPSLQPGIYDLRLTGLDGDNLEVYAAGPMRIEVGSGQNNLGNYDLSRL